MDQSVLETTCAPGALRWDRAFRVAIRRRPGAVRLSEDARHSSSGHGPAQLRPLQAAFGRSNPYISRRCDFMGPVRLAVGAQWLCRRTHLAGRPPVSADRFVAQDAQFLVEQEFSATDDSLAICRRPAAVCQRRFPAVGPTALKTPPQDDSGPQRERSGNYSSVAGMPWSR